ncbi:MAG: hypothetical protein OMM_14360, partial [Candidatus Magnetoglobus multicellularis str. Araruama]
MEVKNFVKNSIVLIDQTQEFMAGDKQAKYLVPHYTGDLYICDCTYLDEHMNSLNHYEPVHYESIENNVIVGFICPEC